MNAALSDLVARLSASGRIGADDVLAMRAQVYGAAAIDQDAMDTLVGLDGAAGERAPEWVDFLAEAMTDFVVHQEDPPDYVDAARGAWAAQALGKIHDDAALEAAGRILDAATEAPEALETFAFAKATAAAKTRGRVEGADVALLRRLVFAGGGEGNLGVTRAEADALFDINDACAGGENDAAWPEFFAKAIADHLMEASPYTPESREAALNDEAWLKSRDSIGGFARGMAKGPDVGGFVREVLHPDQDALEEWAGPNAAFDAAEAAARPITDDEARWLIGRLGEGALSPAERALIDFLRAEAPQSSGLLQPLLGGGAKPVEEAAPVFGQRRAAPG